MENNMQNDLVKEVKEKKLPNSTVEIDVTISADRVKEQYNKSVNSVSSKAKVDGFRAGKAPLELVKKKFATQIIDKTLDTLLNDSYREVLMQTKKVPMDRPNVHYDDFDLEKDFTYKATFEVYPTVELKDYKSVAVDEKSVKVTDKDIEVEIQNMIDSKAELEDKDESAPIEKTDSVTLEYKLLDEKEGSDFFKETALIAGKSQDDHYFDKYVIGMKVGDEKNVSFKYPKDYHVESLAGKKVEHLIRIKKVSKRILPELNDDYAKEAMNVDTVDQMKSKLRDDLEKYSESRARSEAKSMIIQKVIDKSVFDIPMSMIKRESDAVFSRLQQKLGFQLEDRNIFAQAMGMTPEDFEKKLETEAIQSIKTTLIMAEVAKVEKLEVSEEEYNKAVEDIAVRSQKSVAEMNQLIAEHGSKNNLTSELLFDKAMDFLYDNAKIKKLSPVSFGEFIKA